MKATKRLLALALTGLLALGAMPVCAEDAYVQPELGARVKSIIEADG